MNKQHNLRRLLFWGALSMFITPKAMPQESCGDLINAIGPFDYRYKKSDLEIVERHHFLPYVENLSRGATSTSPGGDLDYTLRASPNHYRALVSMINLANKEKRDKPMGSRYSVACWLDRAERFAPNDEMVKYLFGTYLLKQGKNNEAVLKLEQAREYAQDNAYIHYNLGLAYFDLKKFDKALASAHKTYKLGFPFPGLRNKLKQAGKWSDPATEAAPYPDEKGHQKSSYKLNNPDLEKPSEVSDY